MTKVNSADARIRSIFQRLFQVAPETVSDQTRRGQLEQWDSLGHLELLEALRSEFGIEIPADEALAMETFADVKRIVTALHAPATS
jgi:acyl carrier protein